MAMFPIFMIGLVLGAICMWAYVNLKRDVPSETRLKLLEDEIIYLKAENEYLKKLRALVQERELQEKKK